VPVSEGRTVEEDTDVGTRTEVEEGGDVGVGVLDVPTRDAPSNKRLINWPKASSGLKVVVTVGRVVAPDGSPGGAIPVDVGTGGEVQSVGFRGGSGRVEFDPSVENTSPVPPAPLMIERALDSEVHATNVPGHRIDGSAKHLRLPGHLVSSHADLVQAAYWPLMQADSPSLHLSVRDMFWNRAFNACAVCAFLRSVALSKAVGAERTVTKRAKRNRATRVGIIIVIQRQCRPAAAPAQGGELNGAVYASVPVI